MSKRVLAIVASVVCLAWAAPASAETLTFDPDGTAGGAVTIDGQPTPGDAWGTINFRATGPGQAPSTSARIVNGKYDSPDVPLGKVDVFIQIVQPTGKMLSEGGRQWPETRNLIAEEYNNAIQLEVTEDNPDQDFALTSN